MQIVFTNSANIEVPERLVLRGGRWRKIRLKVRCGLIRHPELGPVLIDAGYGPRVTQGRNRSWGLRFSNGLIRPELIAGQSPVDMLTHHGFTAQDVKLVVLTHLHSDHIGHLRDFPNARFIIDRLAWDDMCGNGHLKNQLTGFFTELLPDDFADRIIDMRRCPPAELPLGLGSGFDLLGDGSALGVPLPGHAAGHFGVCFPNLAKPLLYATDVQWVMGAILSGKAPGAPATLICQDQKAWQASTNRVRKFQEAGGDVMVCHDPASTQYDLILGDANQAGGLRLQ